MVSIPICILHSLKGLRNMKLEEEIFQKCIFNTHKLQKYGFTEKEGSYTASNVIKLSKIKNLEL